MDRSADTVGNRIRKRREAKSLERKEFAKLVDIPYSTIAEIENGKQKSSTKLHRIASVLGVRVEWLETGAGPIEPTGGAQEPAPIVTERHTRHDILVSRDGAELGAEWDKIEGDEYKKLARDFVYGLVSAQKRETHRPGARLTNRAKGPRTRDRRDARNQ